MSFYTLLHAFTRAFARHQTHAQQGVDSFHTLCTSSRGFSIEKNKNPIAKKRAKRVKARNRLNQQQ